MEGREGKGFCVDYQTLVFTSKASIRYVVSITAKLCLLVYKIYCVCAYVEAFPADLQNYTAPYSHSLTQTSKRIHCERLERVRLMKRCFLLANWNCHSSIRLCLGIIPNQSIQKYDRQRRRIWSKGSTWIHSSIHGGCMTTVCMWRRPWNRRLVGDTIFGLKLFGGRLARMRTGE